MCQFLSGIASSLKLMEGLLEDIMQERKQYKRFCGQFYGGLHYIKILKHILKHAMHVNEQINHRGGTSFN